MIGKCGRQVEFTTRSWYAETAMYLQGFHHKKTHISHIQASYKESESPEFLSPSILEPCLTVWEGTRDCSSEKNFHQCENEV